jgi:hypothetical protein
MRKTHALAAILLASPLLATTAYAGGLPEKVEPQVVCGSCGAPSSAGGMVVPLLLLLVLAAAAR